MYVISEGKTYKYLYNEVYVKPEIIGQIEKYSQEFNLMTDEFVSNYEQSDDLMQIKFYQSGQKLGITDTLIHPEKYLEYFFRELQTDAFNYDPFLIEWTEEIVDRVFKMNYVRPLIEYDYWLHVLYYLENFASISYVSSIYFRQTDTLELFTDIVRKLISRYKTSFSILVDNNHYEIYTPNQLKDIIDRNDDYNRPTTELNPDFWAAILPHATTTELTHLYSIDDLYLNAFILAEIDSRSLQSSNQPII